MPASTYGLERGRLRPGHAAEIHDISNDGVAFETTYRVLPGRTVDVLLLHDVQRRTMRGTVVRCTVRSVTASRICYVAAVTFEQSQTWIDALELSAASAPWS